eukprot:scaffold10025_cov119-Isochrysis_galbana.AAC.10
MLPKRYPSVEVHRDAGGAENSPNKAVPRVEAKELKAGTALNGELETALHRALPSGPGGVLLLTFGDKGYRAAIHNFVAHAEAASAPHVVGAVDRETFEWLSARGTPSYLTALAHETYQFDGSNAHASDAWAKFARMRTGEIARVVGLGYAVMHTDTDVVWLRDPTPYLLCDPELDAELSFRGASCGWLKKVDVAVSSDNMSPGEDLRIGAAYAAGGERAQPPTPCDAHATHSPLRRSACLPLGRALLGPTRARSRPVRRHSQHRDPLHSSDCRRPRVRGAVALNRDEAAAWTEVCGSRMLHFGSAGLRQDGGRLPGPRGAAGRAVTLTTAHGRRKLNSGDAAAGALHERPRLLCAACASATSPSWGAGGKRTAQPVRRSRHVHARPSRRHRKGAAFPGSRAMAG